MARHNHNACLPHSRTRFFPTLVALIAILAFSSAAHAAQVTLAWDPNTQPEVTGYKIYWGTSSGTYTNSVDVGNVTTYTVCGLNLGSYYFSVTAYDNDGHESTYSNVVIDSI